VDAEIVGQLRMKRSEQHPAVASEDRLPVVLGQDLDAGAHALDHRRPDEHTGKGVAAGRPQGESRLERLPLPPVAVAPYGHVDRAERTLVGAAVDNLACEHDESRAHRQCGHAVAQRVA